MSTLTFGPLGVFGKVRSRGDFLRLRAAGEPFASFDAFLTDCQQASCAQAVVSQRAQLAHAFAFRAAGERSAGLLAGALVPSADSAGRAFPLVVACAVHLAPALSAEPELLPLLLEPAWFVCSDVIASACSATNERWLEQLPELATETEEMTQQNKRGYERWKRELELDDWWRLLLGAQPPVAPAQMLEYVAEAVLPYRGRETADTPLSLRLPLGAAGGAAVCFWLDFVRRLALWRRTVPSFFWSHDGTNGTLLLCLGRAPRSSLSELWQPTNTRDEICDPLTSAASSKTAAAWSANTMAALLALAQNRKAGE